MGVKALARQSSHYLGGQVLMMMLGFVSYPIFTRVFTVADYGTVDLIQRLVLLGTALGKLGVQNAVIRFYNAKLQDGDKSALRTHISTAVLGTGLSGVLVAAVLTLAFLYFNPAGPGAQIFALAAGGLALTRILQAILGNVLRVEERTGLYTVTNVGMRALTIGAILALFAWRGRDLQSYFFGTIAVEGLVIAALLIWLFQRGLLGLSGLDWGVFRSMVAFGMPLIAFECLTILMDAGDRVLIRYFLGADQLGYYTAAFALCIYLHDLIMTPINLALTPMYLKIWSSDGAERTAAFLSQSLRMYMMAACGVLAGVIVCSQDAVMVMASKKYASSAGLVPWIVAGMFLYAGNSFFNAGMVIHKRTGELAKFSLIVVFFKVISNSLLLPRLGLNGAVISTVAAYGLFMVLTARASMPLLPLRVDAGTLTRGLVAMAVAAGSASLIHTDSHFVNMLLRGACAVTVYTATLTAIDREARGYLGQGLRLLPR